MKSYPFIPVLILAAVLGISACSSSEEGFAPDTAQTTMILDTVGETTLPSPTPTPTPTPLPPAEEIAAMEPKTVTVSFVGDLTLTEDARSSSSIGFNAVVGDDYEYCFQNCKDIFLADDLTLGNLENAVTDLTSYAQKEFVFKMKPEALEMLQIAGIEAVNIANNHTKDFKLEGLEDTRD
ncbi:MAG: CapA family protein, partial [Clostridiales bacterium]|nr:CapA family protein [Clostridiales bacterium]